MAGKAASTLHAESIVVDAVCPLGTNPAYIDWYREGGVTAYAPSVGGTDSARATLNALAQWHRLLCTREDLLLVRRAGDIQNAKKSGRMGIYLHFQGTEPIEDNLDLLYLYKALGVGVIQLTYNVRNRVGDGCEEKSDAGLSRFGIRLIQCMNEARIVVDCTHTGLRSSLDAIEFSTAPVILSHSNMSSVHPSARNAPNELVDAIAKSGGVVGIAGFPAMVAATTTPSLEQYIAHIDAVVQRVGIDHVGLGIDYYSGQAGVASNEAALERFNELTAAGLWSAAYPPPPHHYPVGIETPRTLPNLTEGLLKRGYTEADVRKVLGTNWLRVYAQVWGE